MKQELVTIATFHTEIEMIRIKGVLENEGIQCFVKDEYVTQMREFSYAGNSGIKLQIPFAEMEKATQILQENGYLTAEDLSENFLEKKLRMLTNRHKLIHKFFELKISFPLMLIILVLLLFLAKHYSGN